MSWENEEWRSALRAERAECRQHTMEPTRFGGGICVRCGHVVDRDEL